MVVLQSVLFFIPRGQDIIAAILTFIWIICLSLSSYGLITAYNAQDITLLELIYSLSFYVIAIAFAIYGTYLVRKALQEDSLVLLGND